MTIMKYATIACILAASLGPCVPAAAVAGTPERPSMPSTGGNFGDPNHPYLNEIYTGHWGPNATRDWRRRNFLFGPAGFYTLHQVQYLPDRKPTEDYKRAVLDSIPPVLRTAEDKVIRNAFEVTAILPGSAATGKLEPGDLIIGINGKPVQDAFDYEPDAPEWRKRRHLSLQLGEEIERSERELDGILTIEVLPHPAPTLLENRASGAAGKPLSAGERVDFEVSIPSGGGWLRLQKGDPGDDACVLWTNASFTGADGTSTPVSGFPFQSFTDFERGGYIALKTVKKGGDGQGLRHAGELMKALDASGAEEALVTDNAEIRIPVPAKSAPFRPVPGGLATFRATATCYHGKARPSIAFSECAKESDWQEVSGTKTVMLQLDKLGGFTDGFPFNCPKSDWIVERNCSYFVEIQKDDGSWGQQHLPMTTATVASTLMAADPDRYMPQVRRAVKWLIDNRDRGWKPDLSQDKWNMPLAQIACCLADYYLLTKDETVLDYLQEVYDGMANGLFIDYSGGHYFRSGAYGDNGFHFGTANIAIGLAACTKVPIRHKPLVTKRVVRRLEASIAEDGTIGYSRSSRQRGEGYTRTSMTAMALLIAGGSADALERLLEPLRTENYNRVDDGHSTHFLGLYWSALAFWRHNPDEFRTLMSQWRWYFNCRRLPGGGFTYSSQEYHALNVEISHEMVSACLTQLLAAPRKNTILTGKLSGTDGGLIAGIPPLKAEDHDAARKGFERLAVVVESLMTREMPVPPLLQSTFDELKAIDLLLDGGGTQKALAIWEDRLPELYRAIGDGVADKAVSADLRLYLVGKQGLVSLHGFEVNDGSFRIVGSHPKEAQVQDIRFIFGDKAVVLPAASWKEKDEMSHCDATLDAPAKSWTGPIDCQVTFRIFGEDLVKRWTLQPLPVMGKQMAQELKPWKYFQTDGTYDLRNCPYYDMPVDVVVSEANRRYAGQDSFSPNSAPVRLTLLHTDVDVETHPHWYFKMPLEIGRQFKIRLEAHGHNLGNGPLEGRFLDVSEDGKATSSHGSMSPDGTVTPVPGVRVNPEKRRVDVDASVCLEGDALELLVTTPEGKVHEAIFAIKPRPRYLHAALLLLGSRPGTPGSFGERNASGSRVRISVVYPRAGGEEKVVPVNELVINEKTGAHLPDNVFVFAGSRIGTRADGGMAYAAETDGDVVSLVSFGGEVLAWPVAASNANEELMWGVDSEKVPELGTPVVLRFEPDSP